MPTLVQWFDGRYWNEWVIGMNRKPGTADENKRIFESRLRGEFGHLRLDDIGFDKIARYRATMIKEVKPKTVNNVLSVLSKALKYAEMVGVIERAPRIGLLKVDRAEIVCWWVNEYPLIVSAAAAEGQEWRVAALLAGEAGLRIGEIRALRIAEDLDLVGRTITVNQQTRHGVTDLPKGGKRRTVPMTATLCAALSVHTKGRSGYVVANPDGSPKTDGQTGCAIERIYARAHATADRDKVELKERDGGWHLLRHSFGTHAALCGVNPWTLMRWMGHKRMEETMLYVHFADAHRRPLPPPMVAAGARELDLDRRVLAMLSCRCSSVAVVSDAEGNAA